MGMKLINKEELAQLIRDSIKLQCLEAREVDNWTWYDEVLSNYYEELSDDTLTEKYKDA